MRLQTDRQTDGRGDSSIPPLTSLRGYNKDWSTLLFALGNEITRVACKSLRSASRITRFTRDPCPFIYQCQQKGELQFWSKLRSKLNLLWLLEVINKHVKALIIKQIFTLTIYSAAIRHWNRDTCTIVHNVMKHTTRNMTTDRVWRGEN